MEQKNKILWLGSLIDGDFRENVLRHSKTEKARGVAEKDIHLIEAARRGDLIIVSAEESARKKFEELAEFVPALRPIVWISPIVEGENLIGLLKIGASPLKTMRLR